jgi:hypothetical protein
LLDFEDDCFFLLQDTIKKHVKTSQNPEKKKPQKHCHFFLKTCQNPKKTGKNPQNTVKNQLNRLNNFLKICKNLLKTLKKRTN